MCWKATKNFTLSFVMLSSKYFRSLQVGKLWLFLSPQPAHHQREIWKTNESLFKILAFKCYILSYSCLSWKHLICISIFRVSAVHMLSSSIRSTQEAFYTAHSTSLFKVRNACVRGSESVLNTWPLLSRAITIFCKVLSNLLFWIKL